MEFYMAEYNARVRITCGGVPLDQIPKENNPLEACHRAFGEHLARKYSKKDAWWDGQEPPWKKEENHGQKQNDTL